MPDIPPRACLLYTSEENDRLRGQWRAEQELCAATCDFHAPNNDEDNREQDTSAMEAMLTDRDETYERFIELEYSYHLQEKTARTGYILHGLHNDDKEIETVVLSAAQAGGKMCIRDSPSSWEFQVRTPTVYSLPTSI